MALGALAIASLVASGIKGIGGLIQGGIGAKKQKDLWRSKPLLGVTSGETANDNLYRQMASSVEMPGQRRAEEKLNQTYSEGVYDAQKGATSGLGATQSAVDLAGKKMNAISDLAGQFAEFKAQRQDALGQWNQQKIGLENERFNVNEYQPWNVKMNEAVSQKQQGFGSAGQGIDQGLGMLNDLAGTNAYMEMIKKLYPNLGMGGGNSNQPTKYNPLTNFLGVL